MPKGDLCHLTLLNSFDENSFSKKPGEVRSKHAKVFTLAVLREKDELLTSSKHVRKCEENHKCWVENIILEIGRNNTHRDSRTSYFITSFFNTQS